MLKVDEVSLPANCTTAKMLAALVRIMVSDTFLESYWKDSFIYFHCQPKIAFTSKALSLSGWCILSDAQQLWKRLKSHSGKCYSDTVERKAKRGKIKSSSYYIMKLSSHYGIKLTSNHHHITAWNYHHIIKSN